LAVSKFHNFSLHSHAIKEATSAHGGENRIAFSYSCNAFLYFFRLNNTSQK
jgi:hypothetical protein